MSGHNDQLQIHSEPRSANRKWLWWGSVAGLVLLVVVVIPLAAWMISCHQANQKLADLTIRVRARGEPLTTVELNEFYKPAAGRPDMTVEIAGALALTQATALKPLEKDLPIVGT